ncbi:MAG: NADH:ubiquinone reductase (Na(+)-transporting) subunit B [Gammaproteobacteria bacterium]|nr:NADH:ubiquinone reductase (Na(+)-transporting) subunit B [Gammaproteobacteria bacterium]
MKALRNILDSIHPHVMPGGKHEKWYALYEAVDTGLYSPPETTGVAPHVRDGIDLKRVMGYVWMATFPLMFWACYNAGYQANSAMAQMGIESAAGWRGAFAGWFGYDHTSIFSNVWHGLWYFLPVYLTTFLVGGFIEVLFATVRGHEVNEGFFVTSILFSLTLPPTIPLPMVAIGIAFGVIIGKEVFGGTGKNFLNPALVGRAFLFFAYPAAMSGNAVWVAVDGYTGATALGAAMTGGIAAIAELGFSWSDAFLGFVPGSLGETSTLLILLSGAALMATGIASWRIVAGVMVGMVLTSSLFNLIGSDSNPMFAMPWYWHLVVGGFAFGMMFMATDPVTASHTNSGRIAYGVLIGIMVVLVRVVNPAFPEGMMLAILFANIWAPMIDYVVISRNTKRRMARTAATA